MLFSRSLSQRNDLEEDRHSSISGSATMPGKFSLARNAVLNGPGTNAKY